jgi:hypothetical protein
MKTASLLWNVGRLVPNYTALNSIKHLSSWLLIVHTDQTYLTELPKNTKIIITYTEQGSSWEAESTSAIQKISGLSCNPKVHCCVQMCPPLIQPTPSHAFALVSILMSPIFPEVSLMISPLGYSDLSGALYVPCSFHLHTIFMSMMYEVLHYANLSVNLLLPLSD